MYMSNRCTLILQTKWLSSYPMCVMYKFRRFEANELTINVCKILESWSCTAATNRQFFINSPNPYLEGLGRILRLYKTLEFKNARKFGWKLKGNKENFSKILQREMGHFSWIDRKTFYIEDRLIRSRFKIATNPRNSKFNRILQSWSCETTAMR